MYPRRLYSKLALWSLWASELLIITIQLCLLAYAMLDAYGRTRSINGGWYVSLVFCIITLVLIPVEYVCWGHHLLDPWLYFAFRTATALWMCIFCGLAITFLAYVATLGITWVWWMYLLAVAFGLGPPIFLWGFGYSIFVLIKMNRLGGRYQSVYEEGKGKETGMGGRVRRVSAQHFLGQGPRYQDV